MKKCKIKTHFLRYYFLVSAISSIWKTNIHSSVTADEISIKDIIKDKKKSAQLLSNLTNKKAYNVLISKGIEPHTSQIRILNANIIRTNLPHLYLKPFIVTSKTKLSMFRYKILHDILLTNFLLYKMGKGDTPKFTKIPQLQTRI